MEDGENGAKCLLNSYIRKNPRFSMVIFRKKSKVLEKGRPKSKSNSD